MKRIIKPSDWEVSRLEIIRKSPPRLSFETKTINSLWSGRRGEKNKTGDWVAVLVSVLVWDDKNTDQHPALQPGPRSGHNKGYRWAVEPWRHLENISGPTSLVMSHSQLSPATDTAPANEMSHCVNMISCHYSQGPGKYYQQIIFR